MLLSLCRSPGVSGSQEKGWAVRDWKNFCVKKRPLDGDGTFDILDLEHGRPLAVAHDRRFFPWERLSLFGKIRRFLFSAPAAARYVVEGHPDQAAVCGVYYRIPLICETVAIEGVDGHYLGGFCGPGKWPLWKCRQVRVYDGDRKPVGAIVIRRPGEQDDPLADIPAQNVLGTVILQEEARTNGRPARAAACNVRANDEAPGRELAPVYMVAVALALLTSAAELGVGRGR
jgi:hypothetical protein